MAEQEEEEEEESLYEACITNVFWDLEDFPVPPGRKLDRKFAHNMESTLELEGYIGDLKIWAYGGEKPPKVARKLDDHLGFIDIMLLQKTDSKRARLNKMILDMIYCVYENPLYRTFRFKINLVVIAKDIPGEDTDLFPVLGELKRKQCNVNVILAIPDDWPSKEHYPHPVADLVWHWTRLFDGEEPIESDT
ncbi:hypothetical protein AALP_AAs41097U000200 [Arabis alpina]|uniref:NYN domain-containing protein n=1 Tax=Arabis alpina TaxID=50452 RepID=A0A087G0U7_ARAAL|nr:hypothetical protein AALP_AAs41097U000200 [Arabis alpina]